MFAKDDYEQKHNLGEYLYLRNMKHSMNIVMDINIHNLIPIEAAVYVIDKPITVHESWFSRPGKTSSVRIDNVITMGA